MPTNTDKLTAIRIKQQNGQYGPQIPVGAKAENVKYDNQYSVKEVLGNVRTNVGPLQEQIDNIQTETIADTVEAWMDEHADPGTVVVLDDTLTESTMAANAAAAGKLIAINNQTSGNSTKVKFDTTNQIVNVALMEDLNNLSDVIAEEFATNKAYAVSQYVFYDGNLYKFTAVHTAGAWNSNQVVQVKIGDEVTSTMNDIDELKTQIDDLGDEIYGIKTVEYNKTTNPLIEIEGTIDSTGQVSTILNKYYHTELVEIKPGSTVTYVNAWAYTGYCVVACYDKNENFLTNYSKIAESNGQQSGELVTDNSVHYISLMVYHNSSPIWELTVVQAENRLQEMENNVEKNESDIETINGCIYVQHEVSYSKAVNHLTFEEGSITNTGEVSTLLPNYFHSEKIPVIVGTNVLCKNLRAYSGWCLIATYDANNNFLQDKSLLSESSNFYTGTWTVPSGVSTISISAYKANDLQISEPYEITVVENVPVNEVINSGAGAWTGKTAVIIGDSITAGLYTPTGGTEGPDVFANPKFWEIAGDIVGISSFVGYGESGTSISRTSSILPNYAMSIRYDEMIAGADLIIVAGGTNDYGTNVALGTIADTSDISFYGALNVLCNGLQTKYLGKRIVFITPIHRQNEEANTAGATLEQYRQAIYDVARDKYGFAVIDGKMMGISCTNLTFKNAYIYDGLHPTQEGHNVYGQALGHALNAI